MNINQRVVIGKVAYVLCYSRDEFYFYIDTDESTDIRLYGGKSFGFSFFDEIPEKIYTSSFPQTEHIFELKSLIDKFVHKVIAEVSPFYFNFCTHDEKKYRIYHRYAKKLANKYGYYLKTTPVSFHFTKI